MAFAIEPSKEIWHRNDFGILANWRRLWRAVEVGVDRGEWANVFLSRWQGHEFWGVDNWQPYPEMNFDRGADYLMAVAHLQPHAGRAKLIRGASVEVARIFGPDSVDFLYIDGAHDYDSVTADIRAWWPALSEAGILAGHDWTDQAVHAGVRQAVTEFAREIDQTVYITTVEGYLEEHCPSWYLYKSGMPGPDWRRC